MAAIGVQNASALIQFLGKIGPPDGECRGLTGNRPNKNRTDWFSLPYPRHFGFYLRALMDRRPYEFSGLSNVDEPCWMHQQTHSGSIH